MSMTVEDLQSAILKWFWCEPEKFRSMQQIENRCGGLYTQFFPDKPVARAKYALFYPLVKRGFIEFYGEDQFALAPTCAVRANGLVLFVNLPAILQMELEAIVTPVMKDTGYVLCPASIAVSTFLQKENIPCRFFDLEQLLQQLPPLVKVIRSWEENTVIDAGRFLYFENKWVNYPGNSYLGVFKKSGLSYAQRVCRLADDEWRLIPVADKNVDAFYYAVLWHKTHCIKHLNANYFANSSQLVLEETFFPLLLERLLIINSLLYSDGHREICLRRYHLGQRQFRLLNNFLNNSIQVANE